MMSEIQLVRQKDKTGCGIACLAMLTGQKYDDIKTEFSKFQEWTDRRTNFTTHARELVSFLENKKIRAKQETFLGWDNIYCLALIGVKLDEGQKYYHWVVVTAKGNNISLYDPLEYKSIIGMKEIQKHCKANQRSPYIIMK